MRANLESNMDNLSVDLVMTELLTFPNNIMVIVLSLIAINGKDE